MFGRISKIDLSLRIWLCDLLFIGSTRVVHARSETMCLSLLNLIFTGSLISGCKACFDFHRQSLKTIGFACIITWKKL